MGDGRHARTGLRIDRKGQDVGLGGRDILRGKEVDVPKKEGDMTFLRGKETLSART
jgi:hypothetical protein